MSKNIRCAVCLKPTHAPPFDHAYQPMRAPSLRKKRVTLRANSNRATHHKQQFWLTYWRLVRHFGLEEKRCLARSVAYRSRAELAYAKITKSGQE